MVPDPNMLNDSPLEEFEKFRHLNSSISSNVALDDEVNTRIRTADTTYGKLTKRT